MYEHRSLPLLSPARFLRRMAIHTSIAGAVIAVSLGIGVLGYRLLGGLSWIDALLNASMILGGIGPVDPLTSSAAKLFAAVYALFSGIIFLVVAGVIIAPIAHRLLHGLHLEEADEARD